MQATPQHRVIAMADVPVRETAVIAALLVIAAGAGLFLDPYASETQFARNGYRGADLVSLFFASPLLVGGMITARQGSTRGLLLWLGGLGYVIYQYSYTFAYGWGRLFLVYLGLLSVSAFTLSAALVRLDAGAVARGAHPSTPVRRVARFVTFIGVSLGLMELAQIIPTILTGDTPQIVVDTGHPTSPVYVLDLGFVVPLLLLTGYWLRRRNVWGYVAAVVMLVKALTVGAGLLAANVFAVLDAGTSDGLLNLLWAAIALGSAAVLVDLLRHLDHEPVYPAGPRA